MFDPLLVTTGMFSAMLVLLLLGAPLAWSLLSVGAAAAYGLWGGNGLLLMVTSGFEAMNNFLLVALPLFIFMGLILQRSGITDDLFGMIYKLMGGTPGGLGVGTIIICAVIAAMAGVSGAATLSLGLIALPAMLARGYDKKLATGAIMAGGALGFLIPPSVLMLVYAFLARESVGKLFAAGIVPGLMLAAIYIVYILVRSYINPRMGPPIPERERVNWRGKLVSLKALILPGLLIASVLGLITLGITSPTEASAVGAGGAMLCAFVYRRLSRQVLKEALFETTRLMGLIFLITVAAVFFSKVYLGLGAGRLAAQLFADLNVDGMTVVLLMLTLLFVLGMFMDDFAITFITVPLFVPIVAELGFNTVWFAMLFILSMQTAYLTPPFGYNLFYMKSVAPPEVTITDLYKAALPFLALQILGIGLILLFPQIALWLPNMLFGG